MINSSTLATPLSPRSGAVKQRSKKIVIGTVVFLFIVGLSLGLYFVFSNVGGKIETMESQKQIRSGAKVIEVGDYKICNLESVEFDTHIPLMHDGKDNGFFDVEDDMLVQGVLCGTNQEVLLAIDEQGLHGSILDFDNVVQITAVDETSSVLTISEQELPVFTDSEQTKAQAQKWREYRASRNGDRRAMNALEPGSVDIHIHLDIDSHMVQTHGSEFAAARYGVELIAVVNRDAYIDLGFNLKVVSINVRSDYLSQTSTTDAYLTALQRIPRPVNVNLLHSLSTRSLGGGIAYLGGLYTSSFCYGVSAINGNFHMWDRYVVAHELGHNFGADHTHEMSPQVDTCGTSCPANPVGTIMSYCHLCSGGLNNIRLEWHERVRDVILNDYARENDRLASRYGCQNFPQYPDVGVPFSLNGDECLSIDTSACTDCSTETCSLDSVYTFTGTQIKASQDLDFCWTASDNCDSISLQTCGDSSNQQFSFRENALVSSTCGSVKYQGSSALFEGLVVSSWCSPDENTNAGPDCDQTVIPLGCGESHSGSTVNDCDAQRRFTFVAPDTPVTVSSCGSNFDTTLSVEDDNSRLYFSDDDGNCGNKAEIYNMNLDAGEEFTIVLSGYGSRTGNYNIEITCSDIEFDPSQTPTAAPTVVPEECDDSIIELECGIVQTGSTTGTCEREQRFVFTATTSMKTISTCGSGFDTMLSIYDSNNELLSSNDDSDECGLRSLIKDLSLDIDSEYTVVLEGYGNQVGEYSVELICQSDDVSSPPTLDPTMDPTTSVETLPPTLDPTMDPTAPVEASLPPTLDPTMDPTTSVETSLSPTLDPTMDPTAPVEASLPPTLDPTMDPTFDECDSSVIAISCGDVLTGNTFQSCDAEQRFTFTATTDLKTISTCESEYDTTLAIYNANGELLYDQDDSSECGRQSHVEDLPVDIGSEYTIVLGGYSDQVGEYSIGLECREAESCNPIALQCGQTVTGRTTRHCNAEQRFTFTATTSLKTISACDSSYDTTLSLYDSIGQRIAYQDDSNGCGLRSVLENVDLEIGAEYTVVLDGYGNAVGNYAVELTCESNPEPEPCDDSIQTLTCGEVVTQSTENACLGQKRFQFTASSGLTTISSCGSEFDTMLEVTSNNDFNRFNDDSPEICGLHAVISNLALEQGEDYFVTLSGYSGNTGNYRLELTCDVDIETASPTPQPTAPFQATYTRIRGGKCQTLDGADPTYEYHHNVPNCEQLCTDSLQCYGYSLSRYSNCLLWTQSDLMGGGAFWGGADCHIKNNVAFNFEAHLEKSG